MKKNVYVILCTFFISIAPVAAKEAIVEKSGVSLRDYNVAQLQEEFSELAYDEFLNPAYNTYPRIFVENIPPDLDTIENKTIRNQLFMQIVLPHVLKINSEILEERKNLLAIREDFAQNLDIDNAYCLYIEDMAKKYEVVTPFKDSRRCMTLLTELIDRVDAVPPSILVSAAALYTKWGTSRIAYQGNNLFKARNWYSNDGIVPEGKEAKEPYRYKIYPSIEDSIRDYIMRINTGINYLQFRNARRISHKRGDILYGKRLVWALILDSNLKNYAGILDYTMTFYRLTFFDEAKLENEYEFDD